MSNSELQISYNMKSKVQSTFLCQVTHKVWLNDFSRNFHSCHRVMRRKNALLKVN